MFRKTLTSLKHCDDIKIDFRKNALKYKLVIVNLFVVGINVKWKKSDCKFNKLKRKLRLVHFWFLWSLKPWASSQDEKVRFIKQNESKVTQVEQLSFCIFKSVHMKKKMFSDYINTRYLHILRNASLQLHCIVAERLIRPLRWTQKDFGICIPVYQWKESSCRNYPFCLKFVRNVYVVCEISWIVFDVHSLNSACTGIHKSTSIH